MSHVFYWGMHPVSWFILVANIAVTAIEWKFLASQFYKLNWKKEEQQANA